MNVPCLQEVRKAHLHYSNVANVPVAKNRIHRLTLLLTSK